MIPSDDGSAIQALPRPVRIARAGDPRYNGGEEGSVASIMKLRPSFSFQPLSCTRYVRVRYRTVVKSTRVRTKYDYCTYSYNDPITHCVSTRRVPPKMDVFQNVSVKIAPREHLEESRSLICRERLSPSKSPSMNLKESNQQLNELHSLVVTIMNRYVELACRASREHMRTGDLFSEAIMPGRSDSVLDAMQKMHEHQLLMHHCKLESSEKMLCQERARCKDLMHDAETQREKMGKLMEYTRTEKQNMDRMITDLEGRFKEWAGRQSAELELTKKNLALTQAALNEATDMKLRLAEQLRNELVRRKEAEAALQSAQEVEVEMRAGWTQTRGAI